jgi:hypothetical protein
MSTMLLTEKDAVAEFTKRVLPGIARIARVLMPTREAIADDRMVRPGVPVMENRLYIAPGEAPWVARAILDPAAFCKKRGSTLRDALSGVELSFLLDYAEVSPWLKLNKDSVRTVEASQAGLALTVLQGSVELLLPLDAGVRSAADATEAAIGFRVPGRGMIGEWEMPEVPGLESFVLILGEGPARVAGGLVAGQRDIQLRLTKGMLPPGASRTVAAYGDPEEGAVVVVKTVAEGYEVEQYYRVLVV